MNKEHKEIARLKYELEMLRTSRPVRLVQFSKELISESLTTKKDLLKSAPSLLRRMDIPKLEDFIYRQSYLGDIGRSSALSLFTNINVLLVGKNSIAEDLFGPTCNVTRIEDSLYQRYLNCDAFQVVAIDAGAYDSDKHKTKILAVNHTKIVVFFDTDAQKNLVEKDLSNHKSNIVYIEYTFKEKALGSKPFIDIYKINPVSNHHPSDFTVRKIYKIDDLTESKTRQLSIIDKRLITNLDENRKARPIQKLLQFIGNCNPVIIQSDKKIDWLPEDIAFISEKSKNSTIESLHKPFELERYAIACSRSVILNFNSLYCATIMMHKLGLENHREVEPPKITVLAASRRVKQLPHLIKQVESQTIQPHEVLLLLHGASASDVSSAKELIKGKGIFKIIPCEEKMLFGEVLNKGLDESSGNYITKIDDDDYYGPEHFADLYAATLQSQADFVGKWNNWVYFADTNETISWLPEYANIYGSHLPGGTFLVKSNLLKSLRFGLVRRAIDTELYRRAISRGAILYSTHRYNYVRVRGDDHTYSAKDAEFRNRSDDYVVEGMPLDKLFC